jgi:hypothetical protein
MARKVVNRKELRADAEAAERLEAEAPAKKKAKEGDGVKTAKRKSRSKAAKEVRLKAFWGVYNQSMKLITKFEYSEQAQAKQKAEDLSASQKTPHFVQLLKEPVAD